MKWPKFNILRKLHGTEPEIKPINDCSTCRYCKLNKTEISPAGSLKIDTFWCELGMRSETNMITHISGKVVDNRKNFVCMYYNWKEQSVTKIN